MSRYFQPTALVGAIAFAFNFSAVAATTPTTSLDTLVITATRSEEKIENIPARISIIEPQIIEQSPIASLPELLKTQAAINVVQLGGYGQQTSIFLRGTNSTQALVLQDGVRLNTATTGAASIPLLDTTDIEQIEILQGPASVLYGTDAIGGVVQMITKIPEKTGAFVTGEVGENKTYKSIVGADVVENGFYAQIRGQRLETDGTIIKEVQNAEKAAFDQKGYSAKFGVQQEQFNASLDYSENQGNVEYDSWGQMVNQDFKNELLNLKGQVQLNSQFEVNARLSQFKDDLLQRDPNYLGQFDFVLSKTQEADLYAKWHFTPEQNLAFGTTYQKIKANGLSYGTKIDSSIDSKGYYIQHQYNQAGIHTQLGLRVEDHEKYGTHTVGQAAIRYQILPLTSVYTNIGTAFRSPNLNELYSSNGNPNLKPEESTSYEIGLDQKLNYGISTGITLYHNKVKNLIDANNTTAYVFRNLDEATFKGSEVYLKWNGDNLYLSTSYNYVRAKDEKGQDLSRRPRQKAAFTLGWDDEQYGVSTTLTAVSSSDNSAYDDVVIPGHFNIDLHGYYQINDMIKVFANVKNLADDQYRTGYGSGSYYINGGRQASVGLTLKY